MSPYEITSLFIGSGAAVMLIITIRADHNRRKKQSTMDTAIPMLREAREALQQEFDIVALTDSDMDQLRKNKVLLAKINKAFGVFEHIAVAVHAGVYDRDLIYRTLGQTFVDIYEQYHLYIEFRIKNHGKYTYSEIRKLITSYTEEDKRCIRKDGKIWLWKWW